MSASLTQAIGAASVVASWRGVTFIMVNSADIAGRRVVQYLFPGVDQSQFPDLGALDGPIQVRGLIIGDDYLIRAKRMRAALLAPGDGTLVHPWWGELDCVLLQPGRIEFDDAHIGAAQFEATFIRVPTPPTIEDTLSALLTAADALVDSAKIALQQLLSPVVFGLALASALASMVTRIGAIWDAYLGGAPETISTPASGPLIALQAGYALPSSNTDTTFADSVTNGLVAVPAAIANAVASTAPAAIASASSSRTTMETADPATATQLLVNAATAIAAAATSYSSATLAGSPALVIGLVAATLTLAQATAAASSIAYVSQDDASAWRDTLTSAVDTITALVPAAASSPSSAVQAISGIWTALQALRAAITADISSMIGRLPAVVSLTVPVEMSGWLIAYSVAGDDAEQLVDVLQDLMTRNGIRNSGAVPAGTVNVLERPT